MAAVISHAMQKHCIITLSGLVQGVGFRYYAQEKAHSLGLVGLVRNELDGIVRIEAEGEESRIKELIAWCESGPGHAEVHDAKAAWGDTKGAYRDFVIER